MKDRHVAPLWLCNDEAFTLVRLGVSRQTDTPNIERISTFLCHQTSLNSRQIFHTHNRHHGGRKDSSKYLSSSAATHLMPSVESRESQHKCAARVPYNSTTT
jgi:hypothetical protein